VVALILVTLLSVSAVYARERNRSYYAAETFREHTGEFRNLQIFLDDRNRSLPALDAGLARCSNVLTRYGVPDDETAEWVSAQTVRYLDDAEQQQLREDVGEVYFLMARVEYQRAKTTDDPSEQAAHADRANGWNARAEKYAGTRIPRAELPEPGPELVPDLRVQQQDLAAPGGSAERHQYAALLESGHQRVEPAAEHGRHREKPQRVRCHHVHEPAGAAVRRAGVEAGTPAGILVFRGAQPCVALIME